MRFLLAPSGTDGDVRPTIVFAEYLREKGHEVVYCAPPNSLSYFQSRGFEAYPLGIDYKHMSTVQLKEAMGNPFSVFSAFKKMMREETEKQFQTLEKIIEKSDIVLSSGLGFASVHVTEYYRKHYFHIFHIPGVFPSTQGLPMYISLKSIPKPLIGLSWRMNDVFFGFVKDNINQWRRSHGLKEIKSPYKCVLSATILSADKELASVCDDVRYLYHQTPYWHYDDGSEIEERVCKFIEAGDKPVYLGFGSMPGIHEKTLKEAFPLIASRLKLRFIVSNGWGYHLEDMESENICVIRYAQHIKLFPKLSAAVHHGAAGTTHTAALAGIPQIIIPHGMDQFSWSHRIVDLGLGPEAFSAAKFSAESLYKVLSRLKDNPQYYQNAMVLWEKLHSYDRKEKMQEVYDWMMNSARIPILTDS